MINNYNAVPYKCPVCDGRGNVPRGFYDCNPILHNTSTDCSPEVCKSCGGSGIVWSKVENPCASWGDPIHILNEEEPVEFIKCPDCDEHMCDICFDDDPKDAA